MLLSILLFLALVIAVLWYRPSLPVGSVVVGVGTLLLTQLHGGMWLELLPGVGVIALLNVEEWRRRYLVAPR